MGGSGAIVVAIITAVGTVTVGYFTLRATVKATEAKDKADENTMALGAWKDLVRPLRDEVTRMSEQLEHERLEHAAELAAMKVEHAAEMAAQKLEHEAVLAALHPLNEKLRRDDG